MSCHSDLNAIERNYDHNYLYESWMAVTHTSANCCDDWEVHFSVERWRDGDAEAIMNIIFCSLFMWQIVSSQAKCSLGFKRHGRDGKEGDCVVQECLHSYANRRADDDDEKRRCWWWWRRRRIKHMGYNIWGYETTKNVFPRMETIKLTCTHTHIQ